MKLEGTNNTVDIAQGHIGIKVHNTNVRELSRLLHSIQTMFTQGVFNVRNGKIVLHFNDTGELRGIDIDASKWRDGKEVISRVSMFTKVNVEIIDSSVVK